MRCKLLHFMVRGPRDEQQDCLLVRGALIQEDLHGKHARLGSRQNGQLLLALSDGMGGEEAGRQASRLALEGLQQLKPASLADEQGMEAALRSLQHRAARQLPENCGATLATIALHQGQVHGCNAGDSRIYRLDQDGITQRSHDHSFVQRLLDKGLIHKDAARNHPMGHIVHFGIGPAFTAKWEEQRPHFFHDDATPPATYLLCSDDDALTICGEQNRISTSEARDR